MRKTFFALLLTDALILTVNYVIAFHAVIRHACIFFAQKNELKMLKIIQWECFISFWFSLHIFFFVHEMPTYEVSHFDHFNIILSINCIIFLLNLFRLADYDCGAQEQRNFERTEGSKHDQRSIQCLCKVRLVTLNERKIPNYIVWFRLWLQKVTVVWADKFEWFVAVHCDDWLELSKS